MDLALGAEAEALVASPVAVDPASREDELDPVPIGAYVDPPEVLADVPGLAVDPVLVVLVAAGGLRMVAAAVNACA
jgi:hypothetical protein